MIIDTTTRQPVNLREYCQRERISMPLDPSDVQLARHNLARVYPTPKPEGDVVEKGPIVQDAANGLWIETWHVRDFTEEERQEKLERVRREKLEWAAVQREQAFAEGMSYEMESETHVIQTRPGDQMNLMTLRMEAKEIIANGTREFQFLRTEANEVLALPAEIIEDVTTRALNHVKAIYAKSWTVKDMIRGATTLEELNNITWD